MMIKIMIIKKLELFYKIKIRILILALSLTLLSAISLLTGGFNLLANDEQKIHCQNETSTNNQGVISKFVSNYASINANFDSNLKVNTVTQDDPSFDILANDLMRGEVQLKGKIVSRDDFNNNENDYTLFKKLDEAFENITSEEKKSFSDVFISKQAYIISKINSNDVGVKRFLSEDFRKKAMDENTSYSEIKEITKEQKSEDAKYELTVTQKLPIPFGLGWLAKSLGVTDMKGKGEYISYDLKNNPKSLSEKQKQAILAIDSNIDVLPDKIIVSAVLKPMNNSLEKEHAYFKGSQSITLNYSINGGKDLMVVTYQIGAIKMPHLSGTLKDLATGLFTGSIGKGVMKLRKFYNESKK
ncbi:MAG: hypothetical protein HQK49_00125 [Oligoflexia bacterium]|nr:hypothetical protein [Oligoflexia bacterium]